MGVLDIAKRYVSWGWSVVPVPHGKKGPVIPWREYQSRRPTEEELARWFGSDDVGLAVVGGFVSQNLAVLDFDSPGAYATWADQNPILARTAPTDTRGDSGRFHVFVRTETALGSSELVVEGYEGHAGEVLANGKLAVLPPTRHPDGSLRRWVVEPGADLPTVTLDRIGVRTRRPSETKAPEPTGGKIPAGHRHDHLTRFAARLHAENEERCSPPLPREEVDSIARWAERLPTNGHSLLRGVGDDDATPASFIITDPALEVNEELDRLFVPLPEYLAAVAEERSWVVEGLLPDDYLVLVGGTSKAGKSCLLTSIAHAVATGTPFVGMPTQRGAVLWCALEESESERSLALRELTGAPSNFYITHEKLTIDSADGLATLRYWVRKTGAKLLVVDPLYGATRVDSLADGRKARDVLSGLKELCRTERVCCVLIHHLTKRVDAGMVRERFADSNQLLAACSMDVLLDAEDLADGTRKIRLHGRGRGAFANRTWILRSRGISDYELVGEGETDSAAASAARDATIVDTLRGSERGMTADAIAEATGIYLPTLRNLLTTLVRDGAVVPMGKFGKATLYGAPGAEGTPTAA